MSTNAHENSELVATAAQSWQHFPVTYRTQEMQTISDWIERGESGCVVGLPGTGRSTLLGFLYHRPDVLMTYLSNMPTAVGIIPIDLNIMPEKTIATLYRVILRAFYQARLQFDAHLAQAIVEQYEKYAATRDPFLAQSGLLTLLALCQTHAIRLVWVLNRFDEFCETATAAMIRTLRSLRDSYKDTLTYLAGMFGEVSDLPDHATIGPLYDILDINVCWVGPLNRADGRMMIDRRLAGVTPPPNTQEIERLWQITGGNPMLLRACLIWWAKSGRYKEPKQWVAALSEQPHMQYRLQRLWHILTQEEQFTLSELQKVQRDEPAALRKRQIVQKQQRDTLHRLGQKGLCHLVDGNWQFRIPLMTTFVAQVEGHGRGRIWQDAQTRELFQGQTAFTQLTQLETAVLSFLVKEPRIQHTYTDIIEAAWPEDVQRAGVSNETLHQMMRGLRKKIEPLPSKPVYIITWRGQPEGGYQFFPEGRANKN